MAAADASLDSRLRPIHCMANVRSHKEYSEFSTPSDY